MMGTAFPSGKVAVPIIAPHPPDAMAVGAVFITDCHPNNPTIFKPRSGIFATKFWRKLYRSAGGGQRDRRTPRIPASRSVPDSQYRRQGRPDRGREVVAGVNRHPIGTP